MDSAKVSSTEDKSSYDSLILDESSLAALPEANEKSKRPEARGVVVYEWLRKLNKILTALTASRSSADYQKQQQVESVRRCQKELVSQLMAIVQSGCKPNSTNDGTNNGSSTNTSNGSAKQPGSDHSIFSQCGPLGPPSRLLVARCLTALFTVGDTFLLFDTINRCNDLIKNKDDNLSYLTTRLAAIRVLGTMYGKLGRMTGRSYEDTVHTLIKGLKSAESQTRAETFIAFGKVCSGLGSAATNVHRDIYKAAKSSLSGDRALHVRSAAASCIMAMAPYCSFIYEAPNGQGNPSGDLETIARDCYRGFDGANQETRKDIAKLLGTLVAYTQQSPSQNVGNASKGGISHMKSAAPTGAQKQSLPLEDALNILLQGFIKGAGSSSGLIGSKVAGVKGRSTGSSLQTIHDLRVGVSHSYIAFAQTMGGKWVERNAGALLKHLLVDVLSNPKAVSSHIEAVHSRRCINHVIKVIFGRLLGENAQLAGCKEMTLLIFRYSKNPSPGSNAGVDAVSIEGDKSAQEYQHVLVATLISLGQILGRLGTSVGRALIQSEMSSSTNTANVKKSQGVLSKSSAPSLANALFLSLLHPCTAPRLAAAWCLRCLCVAVPSYLTPALDSCLEGIDGSGKNEGASEITTAGFSAAISALLGAVRYTPLGIPHTRGKIIFNIAEGLLRSACHDSRLSIERTRAGWIIIGAIMTLGSSVVKGLLPRMILLWRNAFPKNIKELDSEKARGDAFTWKVSLEGRAGALAVMHSFLENCPDLVTEDLVRRLCSSAVEGALSLLSNADTIMRNFLTGPNAADLKVLLAMLRFRFYQVLSLLPPDALEGSYAQLLRLLVAEFTLTDDSQANSNTTTSLLTSGGGLGLCNSEDALLLHGVMPASLSATKKIGVNSSLTLSQNRHIIGHSQSFLSSRPSSGFGGNVLSGNNISGLKSMMPGANASRTFSPSDEEDSIEEQILLMPAAYGAGAIEHDITSLYRPLMSGELQPGPFPLGVTVVDASIAVFGLVFPRAAHKHKFQMLDHFFQHLNRQQINVNSSTNFGASFWASSQASPSRAEALNVNIYAAVLASLRGLTEFKISLGGQEDVRKAFVQILAAGVTSPLTIIRCAASESLGRLAQVTQVGGSANSLQGGAQFVADSAQKSFDALRSARDAISRTGHSLALGCLHRSTGLGLGQMGTGRPSAHLHTAVSILLALARDVASPPVQVWAIHSLTMISESGGPMFRGFVEPTLSTVLKLLLESTSLEVIFALGKLHSALITSVGPELQDKSIHTTRSNFLCVCAILKAHWHPGVRSQAILALQQIHMFAGPTKNSSPTMLSLQSDTLAEDYMPLLVPRLCKLLASPQLVLRRAAVSCLRQLAQKEASDICKYAEVVDFTDVENDHDDGVAYYMEDDGCTFDSQSPVVMRLNYQSGLPGMLFSMLDYETDFGIISDIHDTLTSIMQVMTISDNLKIWLALCREVLSDATSDITSGTTNRTKTTDDSDTEEFGDDIEVMNTGDVDPDSARRSLMIQPRWSTRVFAAICLRKIIENCCKGNRAHYDLELAREIQLTRMSGDFLVLHLSELIRVAFMAATSDSDPLRLEGLKILEVIIQKFGETPEPEFPGHVILEQYQAQVGAALRPAFASDTPAHVTAAACDVCSAWIGSGVARDLSDLRRVYQLLVTSLSKLRPRVSQTSDTLASHQENRILYNESALTLEKLSILKAWADVYKVSMKDVVVVKNLENDVNNKSSANDNKDNTVLGKPTNISPEKATEVQNPDDDDFDDDFGDFESGNNVNNIASPMIKNEVDPEPSRIENLSLSEKTNSQNLEKQLDGSNKKNLASLVQSELPSLSKYWLAALKDHALLLLPFEYSNQLPYEGGAFYSNDTIELARPHYLSTWSSILEASAIWLTYDHGFDNIHEELLVGSNDESYSALSNCANIGIGRKTNLPANAQQKGATEDLTNPSTINSNRFHLLLGVCMEAISNTRSAADLSKTQVLACLRSLRALFDSDWARKSVLVDPEDSSSPVTTILVEICNGLHRTVLTRDDSPEILNRALEVLQLLLLCGSERLECSKKRKLNELGVPANKKLPKNSAEMNQLPLLAEGGESGKLNPSTSIVFASLEVCFCILVRYYPELSPKATSNLGTMAALRAAKAASASKPFAGTLKTSIDKQEEILVTTAISILARLPDLCSPKGAVNILPSVLWLVTGVLRESETAMETDYSQVTAGGNGPSPKVSASLQALKALVTTEHSRDQRSYEKWTEILQSGLLRVLDLAKTSQSSDKVDTSDESKEASGQEYHDMGLLLAVAIFMLHGPPGVITAADNIKYPAINAFVRAFQQDQGQNISSGDTWNDISSQNHFSDLKRRCVQTATSIFQLADRRIAIPFLQAMAPPIIQHLVADKRSRNPKMNEFDLALTLECIHSIEILILTPNLESKNQDRMEENTPSDVRAEKLLMFLIPVLISYLIVQDENSEPNSTWKEKLGEFSLKKVTEIGQRWPNQFRQILSTPGNENLKFRLEAAARTSQEKAAAAARAKQEMSENRNKKLGQGPQMQPSIKLKMDFSNFASAK